MKPTDFLLIFGLTARAAPAMLSPPSPAMIIPAGSDILVRVDETIDSRTADGGRVYAGTIDQDIFDSAGNVAVRKGSKAELLVREVEPKRELVLDLQSVIVDGKRHFVNADDYDALQRRKGIGKNWRAAKIVGGGPSSDPYSGRSPWRKWRCHWGFEWRRWWRGIANVYSWQGS